MKMIEKVKNTFKKVSNRPKFIYETDEEKCKRIVTLCKEGDYGLCPPPMDASVALNELARYLLGDDWYIATPMCQEQANTEIVCAIELKYKRKVRKDEKNEQK